MSETTLCPRRAESFGLASSFSYLNKPDDGTCDYCGSLLADTFMARLEAGDVVLTPTDKNYKVYVRNVGGEQFKQSHRTDSSRAMNEDNTPDQSTWEWTTKLHDETKFYFQHLSPEQMRRFVELYNEKRFGIAYPGHFYNLPFFMRPAGQT